MHDRNGAMTKAIEDNEAVRSFAYNSRGQFAGLTVGGKTETCAYDAMGNRIKLGGMVLIPDFTDGLSRPLHEETATSVRYYLWGNNELLGVIDSNGAFTVTYSDSYSSIIAHADVSGSLLSNVVYGPHGEIWSQIGTPLSFGWLGGYGVRLQSENLYLTHHRLYDVVRQRFLSSDPMGIDGGLNLYAYANGDALAFVDPTGLCSEEKKYSWWDNFRDGFVYGEEYDDRYIGGWGVAGQFLNIVTIQPFQNVYMGVYEGDWKKVAWNTGLIGLNFVGVKGGGKALSAGANGVGKSIAAGIRGSGNALSKGLSKAANFIDDAARYADDLVYSVKTGAERMFGRGMVLANANGGSSIIGGGFGGGYGGGKVSELIKDGIRVAETTAKNLKAEADAVAKGIENGADAMRESLASDMKMWEYLQNWANNNKIIHKLKSLPSHV